MAQLTITAAEGTCGCGCGTETAKGRRFKQGHDARLKSMLYKAIREGDGKVKVGGKATTAQAVLTANGWPQPAEKKARKAAPKKAASKPRTRKAKAA